MVDFKAVMQEKYGGGSKISGNTKSEYASVTDFREEMRKKYGSNQQAQPASTSQASNTYTQQANAPATQQNVAEPTQYQDQFAQKRAALDEEAANLNARIAELGKIPEMDENGFRIKTDDQIVEQANAENRLKEIEAERSNAYSYGQKTRRAELEKQQKAAIDKLAQIDNEAAWALTTDLEADVRKRRAEAQAELDKVRTELNNLDASKVDYRGQERVVNTALGFGEQWASGQVNTAGTLLAGGNALQDASSAEDRAINDSLYSGWVTDDLSRANFIDAGSQSAGILEENKAVEKKVTDYADKLAEQSATHIGQAKQGLGAGGQLAVDLAGQAIQMGLDAATGASSVSMLSRSFGSGAQQARQEGATLGEQFAYGALSSATEVLTEKLFDGLAGVYGKGAADDLVKDVISKMATDKTGQIALRVLASSGGEALEETISGLLDPLYQKIYNDKTYRENLNVSELLYSALVGGILGGVGGVANVDTYRFDDANAQATASPQSVSEGEGDIQTPTTTTKNDVAQSEELNSVPEVTQEAANQGVPRTRVGDVSRQSAQQYDAVSKVEDILAGGNVNNTTANEILDTPELKAQFQAITGARLNGTREQNRQEIRNAVRAAGYARGVSIQIAQEQNAAVEREAESDKEVVDTIINDIIEQADTNERRSQNSFASYVRGVLKNGATKSDAKEILNNPEAKDIWEKMTGKKLPENRKSATKMLMLTTRNVTEAEFRKHTGIGTESTAFNSVEVLTGISSSKKAESELNAVGKNDTVINEQTDAKPATAGRSKNVQDIIDELNEGSNKTVDIKKVMSIPEIVQAEEANSGEETINLPNREAIQKAAYDEAIKKGSWNPKEKTYNGEIKREKRIDIVIGLPGSGKSSVYTEKLSSENKSRVIDTDDFREYIPEYNRSNAAVVHEEASAIRNSVMKTALNNGENILFSTIGHNPQKLEKDILRYKELGYSVFLHLNEVPNNKSIARAIGRYINENGELGRYVSPALIHSYGNKPTETYKYLVNKGVDDYGGLGKDIRESGRQPISDASNVGDGGKSEKGQRSDRRLLDGYDWYNNDVEQGTPPILIESSDSAKGGAEEKKSTTYVGGVQDENLGKNVKEMPAPDKSELVVTPRSDGPKTTNEFKAQEWRRQQEQAEAKKANAESEAGRNVRSMEAPTAEDMKSITANNNFGVYTQKVSETSKALSYRVGEMAAALKDKGRKDLTSEEKRELDVARRLESLAKQVESVANGDMDVAAFESYYRKLEYSDKANVRRMYFPDVAEKLSRASALLNGESANPQKGQKAAYEAIAMLNKRVEQRSEADSDIFNIMRNIGEKTKAIKGSAAFKGLLKGFGKRNKSLTQDLVNPSLMLKMIDGCSAHNKAEGYKLAKDEQQCNENDKIYRVEANGYFDDFIAMEGSSDFLSGKTESHISIPLGNEESRNLSEIELVNLIKMYDSAMATRSAEDPEPDGFMVMNGKEKIFVPFKSEEDEQGFSISDARLAYGKLLNDNGVVKAYNDSLAKMFDYFSGKMSDACEARNGYKLELIDEIYYPVKYASKRTGAIEDDMSFFDTLGTVKGRTREAGGFLAIGSDSSAVTNYINNAAQYAAWAEFSQQMKMLSEPNMEGDSLVSVFEGAYGTGMAEQMKSYVEDLQFKTSFKDKTFLENAAGILRKNLGTAAITLKLTTPAKQAAGTLAAGGEINMKYLLASQFGGGKKFSDVENKLLQHRGLGAIDPTIDNININGDVWWQKAVSKLPFGKKWLNAVSTADRAAIKNIYKAAAMQVCAEHGAKDLSDPKIKAEVDELFARALLGTQSDATHISNSRLYRSDNEFVKNLTLFTAQSNAQLNATLTAAMEAAAAKGTDSYDAAVKKRNAVYGAQVASSVEYALLGMLVKAALHKFKKDDEEENELMSFAAELGDGALETMASIHLLGNTAYSLFKLGAQLVGGKEPDTIYSISAGGLSSVSDVISKLNRLVQTPNIRNAKNLALSVGNFTGVPLSGAYDFVNAALLWSRDIYRAFSGEEFDGDEYSDVLAFVDAERKKETIEYKDVKYEMTRKESREYRQTKESTYKEYLDYVLNMDLYKNSDADTQKKIDDKLKEYANDYAKDKYLTSKGVEFESEHDKLTSKIDVRGEDDAGFKKQDIQAMPEKDIPKYLAYSAAMTEAKGNEDYDAVDALLSQYSKVLTPQQRKRYEYNNTSMGGLLKAHNSGVGAEDYYTVNDSIEKQAEKRDITTNSTMAILDGIINADVSQKTKDIMISQKIGNDGVQAAYKAASSGGYNMSKLPDLWEELIAAGEGSKTNNTPSQSDINTMYRNNPELEYIFEAIWNATQKKSWDDAVH